MKKSSLFIGMEELKHLNSDDLKNKIWEIGKLISELTLKDYLFDPITSEYKIVTTGVYVFFEELNTGEFECLYVGKCSSRSFIERIPAHFDGRDGAWFHSFIKHLKEKGNNFKDKEYKKILTELFFGSNEVLITFIPLEAKEDCNQTERFLRAVLDPSLNSYKTNSGTKRDILKSKTISEHLENIKKV